MKTPNLDNQIERMENDKKKGINSTFLNERLNEYKSIKEQLTLKKIKSKMIYSKWYLVNGENANGNYALIKEEKSDKIVAEFPAINYKDANKRQINLNVIVNEHNKTVKLLKDEIKRNLDEEYEILK